MPAPSADEAVPTAEGVREIIRKDLLAADLKCSLFASALQSYKRDSVLRPFPGHYTSEDSKDFEALVSFPHPAGQRQRWAQAGRVPGRVRSCRSNLTS